MKIVTREAGQESGERQPEGPASSPVIGLQPLPHQVREAEFLLGLPRTRGLLLSETGCGKTVTLGLVAQRIGGRCLWVTGKSLLKQATSELQSLGLEVLSAEKASVAQEAGASSRPTLQGPGVFITTHGMARSRLDDLLAAGPWDLVVVDEASILGGGGTDPQQKTYRAIKDLASSAKSVVAATAEPVGTLHLLDLWALGDAVGVPGWPTREYMHQQIQWQEFRVGRRVTRQPVEISEVGAERLFQAMEQVSVRTTLDEVMAESGPAMRQERHPVPLSPAALENYRNVVADGITGHVARARASRDADALVSRVMHLLGREYANHRSVVIYTGTFDLLDPLVAAPDTAGISHLSVVGADSPTTRHAAVEAHRRGEVRCLIGTAALETGLNLQHASLLVSVVESYSPARERQREGRIRRIGSPHAEVVHAVVYPDVPLEWRREQLLAAKATTAGEAAKRAAMRRGA